MSRVRTHGAEPAVGGEIEKRGSKTAPGRAKGLEENGAGPFGGGGGERGISKHRGQGQARWVFRAWRSGGYGIYRAHTGTQRAVRERGRRTWQRPKQDSWLTNSSLHCFIVPLTCSLYLSDLIKYLYIFMLCFAIIIITRNTHAHHASRQICIQCTCNWQNTA